MSAPILRIGKVKATGHSTPQSVDAHLCRSRSTPNADAVRTPLNRWIIGSGDEPLNDGIDRVLNAAKIDRSKLRKDATLANDILLTVSPEWFRPDAPEAHGTWDEARLKIFTAEAQALLTKTFGKRVVKAVLHLDEATPHIQAVVVPVMRKGEERGSWRLSGRDMFDPVRLSQLQQDWEDRLRPHGVGPRIQGSRARHTTLREYYGALEASRAEDRRDGLTIAQPPSRTLLEAPRAHQERVEDWRRAEAKRIREELRPLAVEASRGRLYDAERRSSTELRADLARASQDLSKTREALVETQDQLALTKDQVARLRATPVNAVASMLGYTGEIRTKENSIDLVKRIGGLDYSQAVAWLAQRFGTETASTAVREAAEPMVQEAASGPPVLTKGERVKARLVAQQLDALAAPAYRITVMQDRADGERIGRNVGRRKEGEERLFSRNDVLNLIPRLTMDNARGGNIFVTPIDAAIHHVLVDDLRTEQLTELRSRGYNPAVILESSPGNHQAVLKVPTSIASKEAVNMWFKDLNRDLGDQKIVGLIHPFRLAGFENKKAKHQQADGHFPFVKVVEAVNRMCGRAVELVQTYASRQQQAELPHASRRSR